jgi:ABC-type nitrate/sulfonate/bicarbonate transport system ATPase subunit
MSAFDNVMLGVAAVKPQATRAQRAAIVQSILERVGLGGAMHKKPAELSQGMRQRVGLARAFALDPKVLLLDEPFGMLDSLTRFELQEVLVETWSADRKTALMVTHDVDEALFLSDRIALMTNGPAARLGGVLPVPFPRPRTRAAVLEHPDYYILREKLIGFLEDHAVSKAA